MKCFIVALLVCSLPFATKALNLSLGGRNIPNNGAGSVLITDIGPDNSDALLCLSSVSGSPSTNWYYKYGESHQRRVQSDDRELGWRRNRGRNPSVIRLRSRSLHPTPGESREGIYTCEVVGDGVVSVGLYYSLEVELTFRIDPDIINLSYTIICTVTGGTVLTSSFTGPRGEVYNQPAAVGVLHRSGYMASVTKTTGNHGDTFTCMASNGASTSTRNYTLSAALPPTNVTWQQIVPSVIKVMWGQPEGGAPVRSYTITVIYGNGVVASYMTLKPRSRQTMVQRLVDDGRKYRVSVMAMSDNLPGVTSFTAVLTRLSPPSLAVTNITSTTATITLSPSPLLSAITPDDYIITLIRVGGIPGGCRGNKTNHTHSVSPRLMTIVVPGLQEASTYAVRVETISSGVGNSPASSPFYFNTSEGAPSETPRGLQVREVTSSSIELQWEPLSNCLNINGVPHGWQIQYWETGNRTRGISNLSLPGDLMAAGRAKVTGLVSNTSCTFQVAAVTSNRLVGKYSNSVTAVTLQYVYDPVLSLTESFQNSSTICVAWQPPHPTTNKQITSYKISYWMAENREDTVKSDTIFGNLSSFCFPVSEDAEEGQSVGVEVVPVGREGSGRGASVLVTVGQYDSEDSNTADTTAVAEEPPSSPPPDDVSGEGPVTLDSVCIQIQFGPTDHCITWTEVRAREVERELQRAMADYIKLECPSCDELIFQGQEEGGGGGVFVCRDNPHMPTYRVCLGENNSPLVPMFIQQWVDGEPGVKAGWLLARVNPLCPLEIPSLDAAEQPTVAMAPTNQTLSLSASSLEMINTCITELQSLCDHTPS